MKVLRRRQQQLQSSQTNSTRNLSKSFRLRVSSFTRVVRRILIGLVALVVSIQLFVSFHHIHRSEETMSANNHGGLHNQLHAFRNQGLLGKKKKTTRKQRYSDDQPRVQSILLRTTNRKSLPLKAYVEEPLQQGTKPLPIRVKPQLTEYTYPNVNGCKDLQNFLPVNHPQELDDSISPIVGQLKPLYPQRHEYAKNYCPVDADPFLPWIHDVFLSSANQFVDFVAHNKRRCRTSPAYRDNDLKNLEPQVALMQSVPITRISIDDNLENNHHSINSTSYRYRLSSIEDADEDGKETRFICQFHTLRAKGKSDSLERVVVGETLSVYPYNYEHDNYRKGGPKLAMLTRPKDDNDKSGAHNEQIWLSVLHFRCPVPETIKQSILRQQDDGAVPTFYVDLVPIRTPPRENFEGYSPQLLKESSFDPEKEWGKNHVLPPVEESGRWANIPICQTSSSSSPKQQKYRAIDDHEKLKSDIDEKPKKKYFLAGCLWASAAFATRGTGTLDTSTEQRLLEWLTYHLYVAKFDHIYIYDNSEAQNPTASLQSVIDHFPSHLVTRIPWKHRICNNNRPMHPNSGERSSQYTAEASCRLRYGPTTEWLISFDTDEYLIPQWNWTDIKSWLVESTKNGKISPKTHILSFFQTRALPNIDYMDLYLSHEPECQTLGNCLAKKPNATFLEAYDCEQTPLPKPDYGWRAKKQIYRPEFVLNHFVHYTTVTRRILEAPNERSFKFMVGKPYERRVDELAEAFMLHTKTTYPTSTKEWKQKCQNRDKPKDCPVGIPYPILLETSSGDNGNNKVGNFTSNGYAYNCYRHDRIQNHFKLRLEKLLRPLQQKLLNK